VVDPRGQGGQTSLLRGARLLGSRRAPPARRARGNDLEGLPALAWADVQARAYEPWQEARVVIDTASVDPSACASQVLEHLRSDRVGRTAI
jgi:hypothetical protein